MTARLSLVIEYAPGIPPPPLTANAHALGGRVIALAVGNSLIDPAAPTVNVQRLCDGLSPREMQVAALMADGLNAAEIGAQIGISKKTVNTYRYRIHEHLGVRNDVQAVRILLAANVTNQRATE